MLLPRSCACLRACLLGVICVYGGRSFGSCRLASPHSPVWLLIPILIRTPPSVLKQAQLLFLCQHSPIHPHRLSLSRTGPECSEGSEGFEGSTQLRIQPLEFDLCIHHDTTLLVLLVMAAYLFSVNSTFSILECYLAATSITHAYLEPG